MQLEYEHQGQNDGGGTNTKVAFGCTMGLLDWEWDIKKVGFEKDSILSFSKVLHWVFVLGKSLIIKMLLISQKENSRLSMTTAKQISFENLKIVFMTSLKLSSTWYCRELPQRRRIQKRSDKTSKPRSNRSCIPSN